MLDIVLRYYPIVKFVNKTPYKKVLEVGSDDYGISPFIKSTKKISLFDVNFRRKNLRNVTYKTGSVLKLPFNDRSFNLVISVDMLEHIPPSSRKKAISELIRVTDTYLFLAFPADKSAQERDKKVYSIFSKIKSLHLSRYINEHIENGLPNSEDVIRFVHTKKVSEVTVLKNMNVNIEFPIVILSNLDFIPILILQKMLDNFQIDILPFFFRIFMATFGWLAPFFSFGNCYRTLLIVRK